MEQPVVKKLSVQSDKMSDRSTELTIWMSHQIVGKTSCPDKQGIGELREENLRIKQGMGGNWELNLNRYFNQISLMQRDTTIWPDLSYFVAPKENKTQVNILYPIYSQRKSLVIQINMKIRWHCESCEVIGLKKFFFCICWGK